MKTHKLLYGSLKHLFSYIVCYASHSQFLNYLIINSHVFEMQYKRQLSESLLHCKDKMIMENSCTSEEIFIILQLAQEWQL
jgi:hypothetical protein